MQDDGWKSGPAKKFASRLDRLHNTDREFDSAWAWMGGEGVNHYGVVAIMRGVSG